MLGFSHFFDVFSFPPTYALYMARMSYIVGFFDCFSRCSFSFYAYCIFISLFLPWMRSSCCWMTKDRYGIWRGYVRLPTRCVCLLILNLKTETGWLFSFSFNAVNSFFGPFCDCINLVIFNFIFRILYVCSLTEFWWGCRRFSEYGLVISQTTSLFYLAVFAAKTNYAFLPYMILGYRLIWYVRGTSRYTQFKPIDVGSVTNELLVVLCSDEMHVDFIGDCWWFELVFTTGFFDSDCMTVHLVLRFTLFHTVFIIVAFAEIDFVFCIPWTEVWMRFLIFFYKRLFHIFIWIFAMVDIELSIILFPLRSVLNFHLAFYLHFVNDMNELHGWMFSLLSGSLHELLIVVIIVS